MKKTLYIAKFFLAPTIIPIVLLTAFSHLNWISYLGLLFVFVVVPILDLIFPKSTVNPTSTEEEESIIRNKIFDYLVWLMLPLMLFLWSIFIYTLKSNPNASLFTIMGWTASMGMACGILGINVGHELGHRITNWQRFVGKALLWTSLRMTFYIEHNWGHHKEVSTSEDPASARKGEIVWSFIPRSIFLTWLNSWRIQKKLLEGRNKGFFSIYNDVFWFTIIQWSTVIGIFVAFGIKAGIAFLGACLIGMILLEMVNYIEHYGLRREKNAKGRYERTLPIHSWNSDHAFSGAALFNLSRHSDHHYIASRPYQILRNFDNAPNMPTGYAGMIVVSWFPSLWFAIMHPMIDRIKNNKVDKRSFTPFTV